MAPILRISEKNPPVADQVTKNQSKADISESQQAMLTLAKEVRLRAAEIDDADFEALHPHGFDDEAHLGASPPSPPSLACPTAWPTFPACSPTPSSI